MVSLICVRPSGDAATPLPVRGGVALLVVVMVVGGEQSSEKPLGLVGGLGGCECEEGESGGAPAFLGALTSCLVTRDAS